VGLTFTVGTPADVFYEPYASNLRAAIDHHFDEQVALESTQPPWHSDELGWSGWHKLQSRAVALVGTSAARHLLSMEAWKGAYLPVDLEPGVLDSIPGESGALDIGSLPRLVEELTRIAGALTISTDDSSLLALAVKYRVDDLSDDEMGLQTLVQLLLAAYEATRRRQPLWIVK
jgi:hypothetical protein